jgi:tRNA-specific 2-thiouridylase
MVKIRYNAKPANAMVIPENKSIRVEFDEPVSAITPGQLAVFYTDMQVAGAGWIEKTTE